MNPKPNHNQPDDDPVGVWEIRIWVVVIFLVLLAVAITGGAAVVWRWWG